jgi:Astacin (Peptidase family M12A)
MWRGILSAALIALLVFVLHPTSKAQQDPHTGNQQDAPSDKYSEICLGNDRFTYEVEGKRYALPFEVIDNQVVTEGDIVIGKAADIFKGGTNYVASAMPEFVLGRPKPWATNIVPYVIDGSVTDSDRALIERAMSEWANATNVRFEKLSGTRDWKTENYVKFSGKEKFCTSNSLGVKEKQSDKSDEEDNINVVQVAECQSWGQIAHEIGHVLGLGHEHTRSDRDYYITILWGNIQDPIQFCRATWRQQALANIPYDYDSIMHYSVYRSTKQSSDCQKVVYKGQQRCLAFVPNQKELHEQEQKQGAIEIGQRDHLSRGDIDAVNTLYPRSPLAQSPTAVQSCVVSSTTTITAGARTITTTKTVPCRRDARQIAIEPPPVRIRSTMRVIRPLPDRWCRPGWCRPRPLPLCEGWIKDGRERPPFDDWDDGW